MNPADATLPCYLGELPDELLVTVASHLVVRRGFLADRDAEMARRAENAATVRSLHALTLTCQRLNSIVTPFLYANVVISDDRIWMIRPLLRILLDKPATASYIQYIEDSTSDMMSMEDDERDQDRASDRQEYSRAMVRASWKAPDVEIPTRGTTPDGLTDEPRNIVILQHHLWVIIRRLSGGSIDGLGVMTIIAIANNLYEIATVWSLSISTVLSFKLYPLRNGPLTFWFTRALDTAQSLCTIKASTSVDMTVFLLKNFSSRRYDSSPSLIEGGVLDEISFEIVDHEMQDICSFLGECESLASFSCRWVTSDPTLPCSPIEQNIDLPCLGQTLRKFETSLQSLTIDTMDSGWLVSMDDDIPAMGSLRDFTMLQHLDVTGLVLWGDYNTLDSPDPRLSLILPSSLETLRIKMEWDDEIEDALVTLLEDVSAALPNLRKIDCSWRPVSKSVADELEAAYGDLDVELVLSVASP